MTANREENPMRPSPWIFGLELARGASRCGARTRAGAECSQPAMRNGRCRMHGGASTGPRTCEGLERLRKARTIHGAYGAAARDLRDLIRMLKGDAKRMVELD